MKRLSCAIVILLAALPLLISSCSDDNKPATNVLQNFTTYIGKVGSATQFQYTTTGDAQRLVTLSAHLEPNHQAALDSLCKVGERVFITYTFDGQGVYGYSGDINVMQISQCYTDTVMTVPVAELPSMLSGYSTISVARSGDYIDMMFSSSKQKGRSFHIVVSEETEDDPMPDVYISTIVNKPESTYDVRQYASFYMKPLFSKPNIQGIKLHVANDQNPYQTVFEIKL